MNIEKLWFADDKIFIRTDDGKQLWQSLLWYPRLLHATSEQRNNKRNKRIWQGIGRNIAVDKKVNTSNNI